MKQFIFIICFFCSCVSYAQSNRGWRAEIGTGVLFNGRYLPFGTTIGVTGAFIAKYPDNSHHYIGASYYWRIGKNKRVEIEPIFKARVITQRDFNIKKKYVGENYHGNEFGFIYYLEPNKITAAMFSCFGIKSNFCLAKKAKTSHWLSVGGEIAPGWLSYYRLQLLNLGSLHTIDMSNDNIKLLFRPELSWESQFGYALKLGIGLQWAKKPQTR